MEEAAEIRVVNQAVMDGGGRDRSPDLIVMPDAAALSDISSLGGVNAVEVPDTFSMLRILSVRNVHLLVKDYGRGNQLVASLLPDRILGIAIKFPKLFTCKGLIPTDPSISLAY